MLLSITILDIAKSWKRRQFLLPDYARVAAIYYLTTITEEVMAPASDYAIMCMVFFIVIKWLSNWFLTTLSGTEKLLILGDVICMILFAAGLVWMFIKRKWQQLDLALVLGTVIASYLFWQLSAPLMRYGYVYVLLLDFLVAGWIIITVGRERLIYYLILFYGVYKMYTVGVYISGNYLVDCYIWQEDYGIYEVESYEIDGEIFSSR